MDAIKLVAGLAPALTKLAQAAGTNPVGVLLLIALIHAITQLVRAAKGGEKP